MRSIRARIGLAPEDEVPPDTDIEAEIATFERKVLDIVAALERADANTARPEPAADVSDHR